MTLIQTEPQKITMRKQGTNFATQGPCPDGFHVPTQSECTSLVSVLETLGFDIENDGSCMYTYLKMPMAGYRNYSNGAVGNQGNQGDYRSATYEDEVGSMYYVEFRNSYAGVYTGTPTYGRAIRSFKNEPVAPDSGWTVLYSGTGDAGIFHNSTDGLISLSSDGTNWITIADKNLGATVVYNYGDTLSQANCGNYYQWGNNYGFPFTGTITTSNTLVDASSYGPGNYYSSSTFIATSYGDWTSVPNDNLWGGVTGNVTMFEEKEIKKIVIYPDGVTEKIIRPVWKPGANTVVYYPLTQNANDYSGNGYNATNNLGTFSEANGGYFGVAYSYITLPSMSIGQTFTISAWIKLPNGQPTGEKEFGLYHDWSGPHRNILSACVASGISCHTGNNGTSNYIKYISLTFGTGWNNIILSKSGTSYSMYLNGTLLETFTSTYNVSIPGGSNSIQMPHDSGSEDKFMAPGYLKDYIIENVAWTATDVANYYNITKGNYGL